MDALVLYGPSDARIERQPDLTGPLEPRQIHVRTLVTGISGGTELSVYTGRFGVPFYGWDTGYPSHMGYLNVGRVLEVGPDVAEVGAGDIILTLKSHRQEYRLSADELWWKVPPGLEPGVAVFAYLVNLGLHALRRGGLVPGETVAVVGLGSIGLATVMMARHFGSPVIALDPLAERRELAQRLGADLVLDPTGADWGAAAEVFGGEAGIDLVVETAGAWSALETAARLVRVEGRISIVALHPGVADFNPVGSYFYSKQMTLVSTSWSPRPDFPPERVRFTLRRNCADILSGMATGSLGYDRVITDSISYPELPAFYARLAAGKHRGGAVCVRWD